MTKSESMSPFELAVASEILAREAPEMLATLASAKVHRRTRTGLGVIIEFDRAADSAPPVLLGTGLLAYLNGGCSPVGFCLGAVNGKLDYLEAFSYEEDWPAEVKSYRFTWD